MHIIKDKVGRIIAISDTLTYQENGNPVIDNGMRAIAKFLVGSVEESDTIPEGWEYVEGVYKKIVKKDTTTEERIEALELAVEMLCMEDTEV